MANNYKDRYVNVLHSDGQGGTFTTKEPNAFYIKNYKEKWGE